MSRQPDRGDQERFDRLFREYSPAVYRCARLRLSPEDAEDVVCETFVVAWRRIPEIPPYELPWLLRVARNLVANRIRALSRAQALNTKLLSVTDHPNSLGDHAEQISSIDEIQRALSQLSPRDEEVLRLLIVDDLDATQIARVLGIRRGAATARIARAKQRLADLPLTPRPTSTPTPSRTLTIAR